MRMADWSKKLDQFIELNEKPVLNDAGKVSRRSMEAKVRNEYETYRRSLIAKEAISDEEFERRLSDVGNNILPPPSSGATAKGNKN